MAENKNYLLSILILVGLAAVLLLLPAKSNSEALSIQKQCQALSNKETCYAQAFENLTKTNDWTYSFAMLRELQKIDPEARGCHFIAHSISTTETRKDPSKWKEIMNTAPSDCSYGAAHGALEVYASTFPDGKLPKKEIPNLCNNPDTNNCTHILGHLLLVLNENNIEESLKECQSLPHNDSGKFECLTGVFMERITAFNLVDHGLATREALNWAPRVPELEKLCRAQTGVPSVACWKEIVHVVLVKIRNDPQKLVDFCERAPEEEARQCIDHALGIIAASYHFQLDRMKPICETKVKADDFKNRCYTHLVSSTLSTIPEEAENARKFCHSLESIYQKSCFERIDNFLKYHKNNKESVIIN